MFISTHTKYAVYCFAESHGLPLLAYADWQQVNKEQATNGRLYICATQEQCKHVAMNIAVGVANEYIEGNTRNVRRDAPDPMVTFSGNFALFVARLVIALSNEKKPEVNLNCLPILSGFWAPPPQYASNPGFITWIDEIGKAHAMLVHSKVDAQSAIRYMVDWMGESERKRLLTQIQRWNLPPKSRKGQSYIDGTAATLFHLSSLYMKRSRPQQIQW